MTQVAERAGVSPQTVSRALGRPELVQPETRERVQQAIRELNYIPNAAARNLASNSSRIVACIIPTISSSTYAAQVKAIVETLEQRGISVLIGNSDYSMEREEHLIQTFMERRPQGFILTGLQHTERSRNLLRAANVPLLEIWETDAQPMDLAVGFSNSDAGYDVGRMFIESGRKRIAFVGGLFEDDSRAKLRYKGMERALRQAKLKLAARSLLKLPIRSEDGIKALDDVLAQAPDTDAIFFSGDGLAIPALLECNRRGIDVPKTIAICGFSDYDLNPFLTPSLTSVRTNPSEMGRLAAAKLLARLDGEPDGERVTTVPHEIMRRESA